MKVGDTVVGPDGRFPIEGKPQFEGDKGGINVAYRLMPPRHMLVSFGTTITTLATTPAEAKVMAAKLRTMITEVHGAVPYDVSTLPIRIGKVKDKDLVGIIMPAAMEYLAANIEVFLAMAQRLEEAAAECEAAASAAATPASPASSCGDPASSG